MLSTLMPPRAVSLHVRLIELLTLSCINHGLWSWVLFWILGTGFTANHPYWFGFLLFGIVFLSPIGLGIALGAFQQREAISRFPGGLGFRTAHSVARAWDWHFSREKPCWVLVTLTNGARIYGLFHKQSFAASNSERCDLYLEAQFRPVESGDWAPIEDTGGVLIMADQISAIEFRKFVEVNNAEGD